MPDDATLSGIYEPVYAHEIGHANYFFYTLYGDFFHALLELEAQWKLYGGTIQAVQSNADAIWAKVINDDMKGFVTAANSPTISWFENSPDWIRLSHKGHDWKWIKE